MKVTIEFCMQWNYAPKAASCAEKLFNHFRDDIDELTLIPSSGGAFEVRVNGEMTYSKLDIGRFPDIEELIEQIEQP